MFSQMKIDDFDRVMQCLSGCIKLPKDFDYKKELEEFLTAKYSSNKS